VRVQLNPQETAGFVDFIAVSPRAVVSPNARIRLAGGRVSGTGSIRIQFGSNSAVVDLSTATAKFEYQSTCFPNKLPAPCPGDPGSSNSVSGVARLSDLDGNPFFIDAVTSAPGFIVYDRAGFRYLFKYN
jgi:hypothetical protein